MTELTVGTRVIATDLETGETATRIIHDNYVLICDGTTYIDSTAIHANGTHVIVVKKGKT
jgi:hypothetical protein